MTKVFSMSPPSYQVIAYYTRLYGAQILLLTVLSAVTIYRKEMSCNHVYAEGERRALNRVARRTSQSVEPSLTFWDDPVWDDLEGAGNYCSGKPLIAALMKIWASLCIVCRTLAASTHTTTALVTTSTRYAAICYSEEDRDVLSKQLAPDVQVHILSYLDPQDVVTFACASRSCKNIVDYGETSMALWKNLWYRDYAWVLHSWKVGREALRRSRETSTDVRFGKEFYFMFGESYLNYVLAGNSTTDRCLVGLHGHIYDLTPFLHVHPGSPDTLLAFAGRDVTAFFEQIGHSVGARRTARSLCLVVDVSRQGTGCGLRPTTNMPSHTGLPTAVDEVAADRSRRPQRPGTLQIIRKTYDELYEKYTHRVSQRFEGNTDVLSHVVNVYFDPMCMEWRAWFTNAELKPKFVLQI